MASARSAIAGPQYEFCKSFIVILQTDNQVHNRPLTSKLQRSHHLPHAKPALGELHVSHLQVGVGKCFYDTGLSAKLISYANIAFLIRPFASLLHQRYKSEEEFVFK